MENIDSLDSDAQKDLGAQTRQQQNTIRDLKNELIMKEAELQQLNRLVSEIVPLRKHVRRQVKNRLLAIDRRFTSKLSKSEKYRPVKIKIKDSSLNDLMDQTRLADKRNLCAFMTSSRKTTAQIAYLKFKKIVKRLGSI